MHKLLALSAAFLLTLGVIEAAEINLALGKAVSVVSGSPVGPLASVTDSSFLPENTLYSAGTVSWTGESTILEIDLGQNYEINGSIVQADNNDTYLLSYSIDGVHFSPFWNIPTDPNGGGLATRPSSDQTTIESLALVNARYFEFSQQRAAITSIQSPRFSCSSRRRQRHRNQLRSECSVGAQFLSA